ncbi:D-lactate dehydrogenase [Tsuneonella sp. CC-YZS046]|uniref:D-lactate dehydrogenase n=1 Tax=Tsuneonella sp. CC-YZS046 TaxID=3042152 RepID=UPI002D78D0BA|nr:D-lactate dehydrogenase [Tsuneonella sp. CC-YZS046]WRO66776.1 D-lactate dehydrogenase [Tsuneonella sp. CC-YZS046]
MAKALASDIDIRLAPEGSAGAGSAAVIERLRSVVGRRHVLTGKAGTSRFATGCRVGEGPVLAVVRPGTLVEQWRVLRICVAAGVIVIPQAANTGLTGGSTPFGEYDRPVILINTMRIKGLHLIDEGRQVVCLPGATLYDLERALAPLGREPHSVIGSSCIGASVFGGICNNSGGALVRRGPAYTELALYAALDEHEALHLVNHLGIGLGDEPEAILDRLEKGAFTAADVLASNDRRASDHEYCDHVRHIDASSPARFNADPSRLFEASGSAGRIMLFAVRLDSFPRDAETQTFYIGTNDTAALAELRRSILGGFASLPVSGEYVHRDAFDMATEYGKDTFLAIRHLGTDRLPALFGVKRLFDRLPAGANFGDRVLQAVSRLFPDHLPVRLKQFRDRFEHHLILKMAGEGIGEAHAYLSAAVGKLSLDYIECTGEEASAAFLQRFAVAGAAIRYRALHPRQVEDIVALDIALRRDDRDWFETLPDEIAQSAEKILYYGHFFCHVFHQDYIIRKGADLGAFKRHMGAALEARGAEYPAEHNVGHIYAAKPALARHYRALDPCNLFNPGIGQTSRRYGWK